MTIKDMYGRYTNVDVSPEIWSELYHSGLIKNGVLDINKIERRDYGHNQHYDVRNVHQSNN